MERLMTVDMIDLRDQAVTQLKTVADGFAHLTLLDVGVTCVTVGVLLALRAIWLDWRKKKGYRMVLRDRNDKTHALLTQIINDGLFEAECAGKISNKEVLDLYREMSRKLDLPDLVPKKARLKIVKEDLKRQRFGKIDYTSWKNSKMPKKFAEYIGKYKFRKAA
jgi:hypothetical protein